MFNLEEKTFMQNVLDAELKDFAENVDPNKLVEFGDETYRDGNVLFKVLPLKTSFQDLLLNTRIITDREKLEKDQYPKHGHYEELFRQTTDQIITVSTNISYIDALVTIRTIKDALKERFYGALLVNGKEIINPLHPLVAIAMKDNFEKVSSRSFRLIVFAYQNREEMDRHYNTEKANIELIHKNIGNLISSYTNSEGVEIKVETHRKVGNSNIEISYRVKKETDEEDDNDYMMVAHQIITEGIVCPYYGTSLIKMGEDTSGLSLSPMTSCNIQHCENLEHGTEFNSKYAIENNKTIKPYFRSVCCGNLNNKTLKGLRSLTHSNASSPYNRYTIQDGALAYADECIASSFAIYENLGIIKPPVIDIPEPEKEEAVIEEEEPFESITTEEDLIGTAKEHYMLSEVNGRLIYRMRASYVEKILRSKTVTEPDIILILKIRLATLEKRNKLKLEKQGEQNVQKSPDQ